MDDPITTRMYQIKAAMIAATKKGLPAINGVDQRLSDDLGVDCGGHNMATNTTRGDPPPAFTVRQRTRVSYTARITNLFSWQTGQAPFSR
jgi:hypothetical protein